MELADGREAAVMMEYGPDGMVLADDGSVQWSGDGNGSVLEG